MTKSYTEAVAAVVDLLTLGHELRYARYAAVLVLSEIYGVDRDAVGADIAEGEDAYKRQLSEKARQARIATQNQNIARKRGATVSEIKP